MYDPEHEDYDDDDYQYYPEEWDQLGKANSFNINWEAWQKWLSDAIEDIVQEKGSTDSVWVYSMDSKFPVVGSSQDAAKDQYFMYLGSNQYSEGVWKTKDSGQNWENISDGYFGGSIGAVSVSDSDPNVLYVGTGEQTVRGNVSPGYGGFWKSYDGGETWKKLNLNIDQVQVGRIAIQPTDPNIVFIAVMGD